MQTGSNTQSILWQTLHDAVSQVDPYPAIQQVLEGMRAATGAAGVSLTPLDAEHLHVVSGSVAGWTHDAALLAEWAFSLPTDFAENPSPLPAFSPDVARWYTYRIDQDALVCLWFADDTPAFDENQVRPFVDLLSLIVRQQQANRQQERATLLADSILESIVDPLLVLDENRVVMMMNPAAEALFQVETDAVRGEPLSEVVNDAELMQIVENPPEDNNRSPEWTRGEETFLPLLSVIHTPAGLPDGWVLALRDVSRFKRLNRNQQEFLRIVSHDLRSPLTAMQGFADMIYMGMVGDVTDRQTHFLDKILSGIDQMTGIVDNIQDAGRFDPETGFYEMQRNPVDLGEIARKIVQNHIIPAEKQELTLELNIDDSVPIINGDENMLTRAITNLVDNAIKYTPNGGKVEVNIERNGDYVRVSVKDDGYGISEEDQKRLFQRHVRLARKEHKKIKGTGLGLFIVRSVAQRHGGNAMVDSVLGEGTTFTIVIPLNGADAASSGI